MSGVIQQTKSPVLSGASRELPGHRQLDIRFPIEEEGNLVKREGKPLSQGFDEGFLQRPNGQRAVRPLVRG